jgi:hypothetical protein
VDERLLTPDASGAEGTSMGTDLLECSDESLNVGVGQVARKVLIDPVPVITPRSVHRLTALIGKNDEN